MQGADNPCKILCPWGGFILVFNPYCPDQGFVSLYLDCTVCTVSHLHICEQHIYTNCTQIDNRINSTNHFHRRAVSFSFVYERVMEYR